ncbi:MAG: hypothetical protein AAB863_01240 [Patescibacteria group bacterium]|mgnify:CR=1 FL=1
MGIETGGPSPEEMMNFRVPESQPEVPQEKQQETPKESAPEGQAPFVAELDSRNPDKYEIGQDFDNGEYKGKVVGIDKESGKIRVEIENKAEDKKEEEKPLAELFSRDTSKYKTGEQFDNGTVRGTIEVIDHMNSRIFVRQEGKEKEGEPKA